MTNDEESANRERWERSHFSDNGFRAYHLMQECHAPILQALKNALPLISSNQVNLIDLGCGNGALLRRIVSIFPQVYAFGIDRDHEKVYRAISHVRHERVHLSCGNIEEFPSIFPKISFQIVLVMVAKLFVSNWENRPLRVAIAESGASTLCYSYDDMFRQCKRILERPCTEGIKFHSTSDPVLVGDRTFVDAVEVIDQTAISGIRAAQGKKCSN